jgi:hypothetical protein
VRVCGVLFCLRVCPRSIGCVETPCARATAAEYALRRCWSLGAALFLQ